MNFGVAEGREKCNPSRDVPPRDPRNRPLDAAKSPRVEALEEKLADGGGDGAIREFWWRVEVDGTPLVEMVEDDGEYCLATFLWRGGEDTESVLVNANKLTDSGVLKQSLMERLEDTDVWHRSFRVRSDWRASYTLCPVRRDEPKIRPTWPPPGFEKSVFAVVSPVHRPAMEEWWRHAAHGVADPFNPRRVGGLSVAEMPEAPKQTWWNRREGVARGGVEEFSFRSDALGNERRVWVYLPAEYSDEDGKYPVVVLLDGEVWCEEMEIRHTFDNLVSERKVPPFVAVMPESLDFQTRSEELSCNEKFVEFVADELLPWASEKWSITDDAARTIVAGQSFGGLMSSFAALRVPGRFGNVLSQSGSFWWMNGTEFDAGAEWLTREYALTPKLPVRFYVEVGLQEWALLQPTRHFRNVLEAKEYDLEYHEYNGGHDSLCWRGGLADGLVSLIEMWNEERKERV